MLYSWAVVLYSWAVVLYSWAVVLYSSAAVFYSLRAFARQRFGGVAREIAGNDENDRSHTDEAPFPV